MNNYINEQGFVSSLNYDSLNNLYITGSVFISGSVFNGNTEMKTISGPTFVVGNVLSGDTANDCHYLDVGNGIELQRALNDAGAIAPDGRVYVKRGNYNLTAAITIPTLVSLVGDGFGTVFNPTGSNRKAFLFNNFSNGELFQINLPIPNVGSTGTEVIEHGSSVYLRHVRVVMSGQSAAQAANESLRSCVKSNGVGGSQLDNVTLALVSFRALSLSQDLIGIETTGSSAASKPAQLIKCNIQSGDIAYSVGGCVDLHACAANNTGRIGFLLQANTTPGYSPAIFGGSTRMLNVAGLQQFSVVITTGLNSAGPYGAKVIGMSHVGTSTNTGSAGISLQGVGTGSIITNNFVQGFAFGITASQNQTFVLAQQNVIRSATTPLAVNSHGSLTSSNIILA